MYSVRRHVSLSHWVYSQLRTLRCWDPCEAPNRHWDASQHTEQRLRGESHLTPNLITTLQKAGTIKKMFTHFPVMPNVWTPITHLNSKKISRSHLSQPEKSSDSFAAFSQSSCWAALVLRDQPPGLLQPECSSGLICTADLVSADFLLHRHLSCSASCPCFVLTVTPLLMCQDRLNKVTLEKTTGKKMLAF